MISLLETSGVVLIIIFGGYLGRFFSKLRKPYWALGYFIALLFIISLAIPQFSYSFYFLPPFSWILAGRVKFIVLAFAVALGHITVLPHLKNRVERILVFYLGIVIVLWFSILPFLMPALIKQRLANLRTIIDLNGICYQTTDYTCGPAAAVTALKRLDLPAEESEIAILAYSSPVTGTLPRCLSRALQQRYSDDGLICEYKQFDSVNQLKDEEITLVVVKERFLSDHCVAVLDVTEDNVVIADPVTGKMQISRKNFKKMWRFSGITLKRDNSKLRTQS